MLHSFTRYMMSWICGLLIAFLALLLFRIAETAEEVHRKKGKDILVLISAFLLIALPLETYFTRNMYEKNSEELVYGYNDMSELLRSFGDRDEKIYYVCNKSDGYSSWIFRNAAAPMKVSLGNFDIYAGSDAFREMDAFYQENGEEISGTTVYKSSEEWENELGEYQYVFLMHPNEVFAKYYGDLFEEPETITNGTFYQVREDGGGIRLHYIGRVGIKRWQ